MSGGCWGVRLKAQPSLHIPTPSMLTHSQVPETPRVTAAPCPCRISSYCKSKGWQRIQDSRREDYKLKWCEVKCRDNYYSFREGSRGGATGSGLQPAKSFWS